MTVDSFVVRRLSANAASHHRRPWHHRRRRLWLRVVVGVATFVALFLAGAGYLVSMRTTRPESDVVTETNAAYVARTSSSGLQRPNYLYSVVPGGVRSSSEIGDAMARDPIVAAHYAQVNPAAMRSAPLGMPVLAHVSYRIGNTVYWTKNRVALPADEPVLTDGTTTIRQRCGNIISVEPLGPVAGQEPPPPSFDLIVAPPPTVTPNAFTVTASVPPTTMPPLPLQQVTPTSPRPGPQPVFPPPPLPPPSVSPTPTSTPTPPPSPFPPEPEPDPVPVPVPEPEPFALVGLGCAYGLMRYLRSRKTAKSE